MKISKDDLYQLGLEFKEYNKKSKSELTDEEIKKFKGETWDSLNDNNGKEFPSGEAFRSYVKKRQAKDGSLPTQEKVIITGYENKISEIELQKQELYKEKVKFYDQRRELNNVLRNQSREEYLYNLIESAIQDSDLQPFEYIKKSVKETDNDILCFLNDLHYGLDQSNYWNTYNPQVFVKYLYKYLDEILQIKETHNSQKCYVFLGGDLISGFIHNLIRIENAENVIEQVQHVSEYISNFVSELSKEFSHVYVFSVLGNHSRLMQNKKEDIKDEKLDALVTWYMKARLSSLSNVLIKDNQVDATISIINIRDKIYYGVHGDLDNPNRVVDSLTQMLDTKPYAVLMCHRHHYAIESVHDVKVISSGSFASVDDYCITKRISGKPSQTVCVCDKNGVRCSYDVVLN